jgi:hypothetical protein
VVLGVGAPLGLTPTSAEQVCTGPSELEQKVNKYLVMDDMGADWRDLAEKFSGGTPYSGSFDEWYHDTAWWVASATYWGSQGAEQYVDFDAWFDLAGGGGGIGGVGLEYWLEDFAPDWSPIPQICVDDSLVCTGLSELEQKVNKFFEYYAVTWFGDPDYGTWQGFAEYLIGIGNPYDGTFADFIADTGWWSGNMGGDSFFSFLAVYMGYGDEYGGADNLDVFLAAEFPNWAPTPQVCIDKDQVCVSSTLEQKVNLFVKYDGATDWRAWAELNGGAYAGTAEQWVVDSAWWQGVWGIDSFNDIFGAVYDDFGGAVSNLDEWVEYVYPAWIPAPPTCVDDNLVCTGPSELEQKVNKYLTAADGFDNWYDWAINVDQRFATETDGSFAAFWSYWRFFTGFVPENFGGYVYDGWGLTLDEWLAAEFPDWAPTPQVCEEKDSGGDEGDVAGREDAVVPLAPETGVR